MLCNRMDWSRRWSVIAFLFLSFSYSTFCEFLKVTCPSRINVTYKNEIVLSCSANVKLVDITLDKCLSSSVCNRIIDTSHNIKGTKGQIKFDHENKAVSLLIPEATPSDEGTYKWFLNSESSGYSNERTTLKVQAPYSKPEIFIDQNTATEASITLTCKTSRGYPLGQIHWFDESGRNLTKSMVLEFIRTSEGLYDIISYLTLRKHYSSSMYYCTVKNERSGISISEEYVMPDSPYSKPEIFIDQKTEESITFVCKSSGGYPLGQIHWFDESGRNLTESAAVKYAWTSEGLHNIVSYLTLNSHDISLSYTCIVKNERSEISEEYVMPSSSLNVAGGKNNEKMIAVVIVVGALASGVIALFIWKKLTKPGKKKNIHWMHSN
nr:PREDICTED: uncharacterized protein LOC102347274 isoform X2 [Latimeria chalumnae]|eukprot:XP_006003430.1 PREDICTED: uncharacterized protein LOC102347274 isoform X2 [Latimeria chalumnae]